MRRVIIISGFHDYRTARRGSIQALADALVRLQYDVTFVSVRFSPISMLMRDHRAFLWPRANRPERVNGVTCYLWRTPFHPFQTRHPILNRLVGPLFGLYARLPGRFLDDALSSASAVVIESGLGIMLTRRARRRNAGARIIYRASDALHTISAHPILQVELRNRAQDIDAFCLLAAKMAPDFAWAGSKAYVVPLGIHPDDFADIGPSPYTARKNAVSVGSMLFDASFFQYAAGKFPDIHFHVIGCDVEFSAPANVHIYKEMPFKDTLPYIKHADFGIASYRPSQNSEYLSQSSLKLMQYEYLEIPAVCPEYAVGNNPSRFGYRPGDRETIDRAIGRALGQKPAGNRAKVMTWNEIAQRLLNPESFEDTAINRASA